MTKYCIKHINNPYLNKLLSPAANLYRPNLPYSQITTLSAILVLLTILCSLATIFLNAKTEVQHVVSNNQIINIFIFWFLITFAVASKYYLIFAVMVYQRFAKAEIRLKCCCYPSCSQYSIIALRKYGTIVGVYLTVKHCINCRPPGLKEFP